MVEKQPVKATEEIEVQGIPYLETLEALGGKVVEFDPHAPIYCDPFAIGSL